MAADNHKIIATNRKAFHDFELLDKFEAGIVLTGSEVKSLRASKANLQDSYCEIKAGEVFINNLHIASYEKAAPWNPASPKQKRKLLMHRAEINRLFGKMTQRGFTIIPLELYFNHAGIAKLQISLAKKRKGPDKRERIKERDTEREMRRAGKGRQA